MIIADKHTHTHTQTRECKAILVPAGKKINLKILGVVEESHRNPVEYQQGILSGKEACNSVNGNPTLCTIYRSSHAIFITLEEYLYCLTGYFVGFRYFAVEIWCNIQGLGRQEVRPSIHHIPCVVCTQALNPKSYGCVHCHAAYILLAPIHSYIHVH